jgi:hypothetical protein
VWVAGPPSIFKVTYFINLLETIMGDQWANPQAFGNAHDLP